MGEKTRLTTHESTGPVDSSVSRFQETGFDEEDRDREIYARAVTRLRLLWEQRKFLVRVTGAAFVLSLLITLLIPNQYQSITRLMPPDQNNSDMSKLALLAGQAGAGLGALAGDALGLKSSGALFVGILQSRTVQDDVIGQFDLRKAYGDRRREDARSDLADKTGISEDRKSGIISLSVTDRSPQRAAAIAQEYVEELNRVVAQQNTTSAHRERVFLEERLSQVKNELESAEKDFSEFASKNTALDIPEQGKAMIGAAATLQGQLIAAQTELEGLKQVYTDNNVRVRATQARVNELRSQLQKLGGNSNSDTSPDNGNGTTAYPSIRQLPLLGVGYADMYRRTKVEETVFGSLTQEYELAKVEEAKETPSVKVLDPPDLPDRKSFPPRLIIVLSCSTLAFVAGGLFVFARASWDRVDSTNPGKALAQEIGQTVNAKMPWSDPNGSRVQAMTNRIWVRLVRRSDSTKTLE
jgi:uncharacterized protein involved in exopolysaccharide biosynthesis